MLNVAAVVSTLKRTVSPASTLISVVNPCRLDDPAPLTFHCDDGAPGSRFSQTIGLGPHWAVTSVSISFTDGINNAPASTAPPASRRAGRR